MKKKLFIAVMASVFASLHPLVVLAQNTSCSCNPVEEKAELLVSGSGVVVVAPTITHIDLSLGGVHSSYDKAYQEAARNSAKLKAILKNLGLKPELAKTSVFNISQKREAVYDNNGRYIRTKFIGFELRQSLRITIPIDDKQISKIVHQVGLEIPKAEINLTYSIENREQYQLKALEKATQNAKAKAEVMAKASGNRLLEVKQILNGVSNHRERSNGMFDAVQLKAASPSAPTLDVTPNDITISANVEVVWYIEKKYF